MHEAALHPENCFVTLTYNQQSVPQDYGLDLRHLQLFMKRLRKSLPQKIRFFACGEYGELNGRPHYHAILFNYAPADRVLIETSASGEPVYRSAALESVWQLGNTSTQDVTHRSCAYVARYCTKKLKTNDTFGMDRYRRLSPVDGCMHNVRPEFAVMSRGGRGGEGGIGSAYVERFKSDFYPSGFIVVNGVRQAPPRFYVSKLTEEEQQRLKRQARRLSLKNKPHQTTERRMARAAVRDARIRKLQRNL